MTGSYTLRLVTALVVVVAACTASGEEPGSRQPSQIPKEKQTKLALYVTAKEAYDKWKAEPSKVKILDVRTELLSKVVDGKFSGGGLLGFDSVDELGALNHVG